MVSELIKYFDEDKYWNYKHFGVMIELNNNQLDTNLELLDVNLESVVEYVISKGYKKVLCIMRTKQEAGLDKNIPHKDTYKIFKSMLEKRSIEVHEFYQQPWPSPVPKFNLYEDTFVLRFGYDEGCEIDKLAVTKNKLNIL